MVDQGVLDDCAAVISVSAVRAGDAANAIPGTAVARGTIRAYDAAARELLHRRLTAISTAVAEGLGCTAHVEIVRGEPVLSNDPELTTAVRTMLGAQGSDTSAELRSMGADDFSYFAEKIPVMLFVGASGSEMLHSPAFLPDDADLTRVATAMLASYLAAAQVVRTAGAYR
jgi:amidohydrolase